MKMSSAELAQAEIAAQSKNERLLLEQEIMGKWARGELVEVVRCEDCLWYNPTYGECENKFGLNREVSKNGYCYYGERKEKTDDN